MFLRRLSLGPAMTAKALGVKSDAARLAGADCHRCVRPLCRCRNGILTLAKQARTKKAKPAVRRRTGTGKIASWQANLRPAMRRWVKYGGYLLAVIFVVPLMMTVIYRLPPVHPVSTLMLKEAVLLKGYDRRWVAIDDISPVLVHSVMMSEDGRFCEHNGIDWDALNQVIDDALDGEKTRGASTIVMQTAKNLYLWSSRSYVRKIIEIPLAWYMNVVLPKKRIMEIYLNIAEWGPGIYGIEAASRYHFGRSSGKLSAKQAALLAVTLPAPKTRNPAKPGREMTRLASIVQKRARQAGGYIGCLQ